MSRTILDSSALLALLNREPGHDEVENAFPGVVMSAANLSEVMAKLVENGVPVAAARSALEELDLDIQVFDADSAFETGALRPATRRLGLSLGDRACLALGRHLGLPVLTMDRRWGELDLGIDVRILR